MEEDHMYEFYQKHKEPIIITVIVIGVIAGWYLFRSISTSPANDKRVDDGLAGAAEQQQQAADDIDSIKTGLSDSQVVIGDIQSSIDTSTGRADSIYDTQSAAGAAVDSAQSTATAIASSNAAAQVGLANAKAANDKAAAAIDSAAKLSNECEQFINSSQSIITKYKQ